MFTKEDHTFVVCAYGESEYLDECLKSLMNQVVQTNVLIATSTPSDFIFDFAKKYHLPVFINMEKPGIASDWNFAISCAKTPLVTIAHQDDIYKPDYSQIIIRAMNEASKPLIAFTGYGEIRDDNYVESSPLINVKKTLLKPLNNKAFVSNKLVRRRILSFGNAICCPAVTYNVPVLSNPLFRKGFRSNLDWDAWERFSKLNGSFVYCSEIEMYHRVHEDSETSACIEDNVRTQEDFEMLKRFWPVPVAKLINNQYKKGQQAN